MALVKWSATRSKPERWRKAQAFLPVNRSRSPALLSLRWRVLQGPSGKVRTAIAAVLSPKRALWTSSPLASTKGLSSKVISWWSNSSSSSWSEVGTKLGTSSRHKTRQGIRHRHGLDVGKKLSFCCGERDASLSRALPLNRTSPKHGHDSLNRSSSSRSKRDVGKDFQSCHWPSKGEYIFELSWVASTIFQTHLESRECSNTSLLCWLLD